METFRFLGFAFASADLLVEIDSVGAVTFAVGATHGLPIASEAQLLGKTWRTLVAATDHDMVAALFDGLEDRRVGPVTVELNTTGSGARQFAALSACRLPPQTKISCAFALHAPKPLWARADLDGEGYQDRAGFETLARSALSAAATIGQDLDLALVEMPGLNDALAALGPGKASALLRRFAGALRAEGYGGSPAARLSPERFAVIRKRGSAPEAMQRRLDLALARTGAEVHAQACVMPVEAGVGSLDRSLRALRYTIERFATSGSPGLVGATLDQAFSQSVQQTLAEAGEFGAAVKARRFNLVYQPIVSLRTGQAEHYETLVRFEEDTSPYKLIRMAEELDLILELDLAIADQALQRLAQDPSSSLRLAVNISGRSIMDPWFVSEVRRLTERHAACARRLMFEITESVHIEDLAQADRHIQQLRADGHVVCLDDFGAGSSSYAYLQKLHVDIVKIDGRYVKQLAEDGRDAALVRHLVNLCRDLGVTTIAEMISNQAIEDAARQAGVDYGQGFHYGAPSPEPAYRPEPATRVMAGKRRGTVEQWG